MKKLTEKIRAKWPIRKGCYHCGAELKTPAEKFTRVCSMCASKAREGFDEMGRGRFKEGINKVLDVMFSSDDPKNQVKKAVVQEKISKAVSKRENKIIKKLKKKGLTDEEIAQGLKEYKYHMGGKYNDED